MMLDYVRDNASTITGLLDQEMTLSEIRDAIKRLKNNKSSSFDGVGNEMIKAGVGVLAKPLQHIFNCIMTSQEYPEKWKVDILSVIHKSGPKDDPHNWRGVCVASCVRKLFNSILHHRLERHCLPYLSKSQLSGRKGARTTDHSLVLKHLIDKYVKRNKKKLYVCYIDLKKAFDKFPELDSFISFLKTSMLVESSLGF